MSTNFCFYSHCPGWQKGSSLCRRHPGDFGNTNGATTSFYQWHAQFHFLLLTLFYFFLSLSLSIRVFYLVFLWRPLCSAGARSWLWPDIAPEMSKKGEKETARHFNFGSAPDSRHKERILQQQDNASLWICQTFSDWITPCQFDVSSMEVKLNEINHGLFNLTYTKKNNCNNISDTFIICSAIRLQVVGYFKI